MTDPAAAPLSDAKPWYASTTIWGALIAAFAPAIGLVFHLNLSDADAQQLAAVLASLGAGAGGLLAIAGRYRAARPIGKALALLLAPTLLLAACVPTGLERANARAGATEAEVCRTWGLVYALGVRAPASLAPAEDALAAFCSGDPKVGATPADTLARLAGYALQLAAAQAVVRP